MIERFIRAVHWKANKRSVEPEPEVDPALLRRARRLHAEGAYEEAIALIEEQTHWRSDPRAWRLLGLCKHGLAQYEDEGPRQEEVYCVVEEAYRQEIALREAEIAKAEVNWAVSLITRHRYEEAMELALRALDRNPKDVTAHLAILGIHKRRNSEKEREEYVGWLLQHEAWIFEHEFFKERASNDPDLAGIGDVISKRKERAE